MGEERKGEQKRNNKEDKWWKIRNVDASIFRRDPIGGGLSAKKTK